MRDFERHWSRLRPRYPTTPSEDGVIIRAMEELRVSPASVHVIQEALPAELRALFGELAKVYLESQRLDLGAVDEHGDSAPEADTLIIDQPTLINRPPKSDTQSAPDSKSKLTQSTESVKPSNAQRFPSSPASQSPQSARRSDSPSKPGENSQSQDLHTIETFIVDRPTSLDPKFSSRAQDNQTIQSQQQLQKQQAIERMRRDRDRQMAAIRKSGHHRKSASQPNNSSPKKEADVTQIFATSPEVNHQQRQQQSHGTIWTAIRRFLLSLWNRLLSLFNRVER